MHRRILEKVLNRLWDEKLKKFNTFGGFCPGWRRTLYNIYNFIRRLGYPPMSIESTWRKWETFQLKRIWKGEAIDLPHAHICSAMTWTFSFRRKLLVCVCVCPSLTLILWTNIFSGKMHHTYSDQWISDPFQTCIVFTHDTDYAFSICPKFTRSIIASVIRQWTLFSFKLLSETPFATQNFSPNFTAIQQLVLCLNA